MPTEFKLYNVKEEELYKNQTKQKKEELRPLIYKMAKERGIKPAARYFNTYPGTVRNIIKSFENK